VGSSHFGRLAGFTNRKLLHQTEKGFPYVLCCESTGRHAFNKSELLDYADNYINNQNINQNITQNTNLNIINKGMNGNKRLSAEKAFDLYFYEWSTNVKNNNKTYDVSRGDFAVACRMIKEGYLKDDIIRALILSSPDLVARKGKHANDYAIRTINAAEKVSI
jgi:hypothetical protein